MNKLKFPTRLAVLFAVIAAAGLPGVYERIVHEHMNTAAPQSAPWGLWIAAYTFFSGISAGAFPIAALSFVFGQRRFRPLARLALLTALVGLASAMIFVMVDLGRPEKSFHSFWTPNFSSMMTYVVLGYVAYGGLLAFLLWFTLRPEWAAQSAASGGLITRLLAFGWKDTEKQHRRDDLILRVAGVAGLALCLGLAEGVGSLFSVLGGRSFWHSGLFPVTFLVSALLSGSSFVLAAAALLGRGGHQFKNTLLTLARFIGLLLVVELIILPTETLIVLKGGIPSHIEVLRAIATGRFAWVFWIVQFGLGTLAATLLIMVPKRQTLTLAATAALLVLVGIFAFRLNFVIPQQAPSIAPLIAELPLHAGDDYVPNYYEWNLVIFGIGFAGLAFLAGFRWLPILSAGSPMEFELAAHSRRPPVDATTAATHPV